MEQREQSEQPEQRGQRARPARVVLVGAGHAHVEVLRQWAEAPPPGAELVLVVDRPRAVYSGMVPGFVAGRYAARELEIDARVLAQRAGARVVLEPAASVHAAAQAVRTASGEALPFDVASLDVGSTVAGRDLPGVEEHALASRPIHCLVAGVEEVVRRARQGPGAEPFRLLVVGAGAGGVELALCFEARLRREAARPLEVELLDRGERPLPGAPPALVRRVEGELARRGVAFRGGVEVRALRADRALLADGGELRADAVVWVPGPASHAWLAAGDLPLDADGYVRIRPTLQVEGSERLFAAGDCASLPGMPKAGVYAVRAGPRLAENLFRALADEPLRPYRPQSDFLSLLNLGDGRALGSKWGLAFGGRWVMLLKDRIDRAFVERYR